MKRFTKIAFVGLVCMLILAAGLWIAGGGQHRYASAIIIDASPNTIFDHLTDPTKLTQWMNGVTEIRQTSGQGSEIGSTSTAFVGEGEDRFELPTEVTESVPNKTHSVQIVTGMFTVNSSYELKSDSQSANPRVQVVQTMSAEYYGIARLFAVLSGAAVQQQLDGDLKRLKESVENPQPTNVVESDP